MGYECRVCGYEPDDRELQNGRCPECHPRPLPPPKSVEQLLSEITELSRELHERGPTEAKYFVVHPCQCGGGRAQVPERSILCPEDAEIPWGICVVCGRPGALE